MFGVFHILSVVNRDQLIPSDLKPISLNGLRHISFAAMWKFTREITANGFCTSSIS